MLSPSHRARPSSISLEERRRSRNRSLSSLSHYSASPFPSFSAYLGSITKVKTGETTFHPFGEEEPLSPNSCVGVFNSMYCSVSSEYSFRPMFCISDTPPLCSPEDDVDLCSPDFEAVIIRKKESASSGYGSAGSESDQDQLSMHSDDVKLRSCRSRHRNKAKREEVSMRRRSMPPLMSRAYYATDFLRVLCREGHVNYETDVDTGEHVGMEIRGMSRPDSVMQLARKFGEISAAQENDLHKSRTSLLDGKENTKKIMLKKAPLPVRPIGGIASLTIKSEPKMSRPNMFKQMEKVGAGNAAVPRVLNPNSIKDALLRWVQNRVAGYPNVNVTNFSSSWADGMAFCALIHRFAPHAFDFEKLNPVNRRQNFELAFNVSEQNGIFPLLEVDDMIMMGDRPDWKCVFTYVQSFYKQFRDRP